MLGGLKLGGVWGQVDEPDPIRHDQVRFGVPAGVVELKHDDAIPSRPSLAGKQGQQRGKERLGDAVFPAVRRGRLFGPLTRVRFEIH